MPCWAPSGCQPDRLFVRLTALYTANIIETYLQLPTDLPPELAAYAAEITAGAETPYDKALAIEATLRKLPYTLDVPAPPKGSGGCFRFLNDLGKGYCDYFASAMVVLARLSGVPARLAIGYASGNYDRQADQYTVTEMDAHSWVEVYFPGFGWIPFEPTPSRLVPERTSLAAGPYAMTPPELSSPISIRASPRCDNWARRRRPGKCAACGSGGCWVCSASCWLLSSWLL